MSQYLEGCRPSLHKSQRPLQLLELGEERDPRYVSVETFPKGRAEELIRPPFLPAAYIARKLLEKLPLQLDQTRDLAALTIAAGPERALRWAQMDRQTEAITPATYAAWKSSPQPSVYVLNQQLGESSDKDLPSHETNCVTEA